MRSRCLAALVVLSACGGGGDPLSESGPFDDPSDFDRDACAPGSLAGIDVTGIWHVDLEFPDFGRFPAAARVDAVDDELTGLLFGIDATVDSDEDDLFFRRTFRVDERLQVRALDLCAAGDDGSLRGTYASCSGEECIFASARAVALAPLDEPEASGITLLGELGGAWPDSDITANVRHADGIAYVVRTDGLRLVDVSDPAAMVELGEAPVAFPGEEFYNDVKIVDGADGTRYAVVASSVRGAVVYDVSDPSAPVEVATAGSAGPDPAEPIEVHTLFIEDSRAYLANISTGGLEIYDLTDPRAPVRLGEYVHPMVTVTGGFVHDLYVEGGRAYLCYWNLGLVIVDTLEDPASPTEVGTYAGYGGSTSHSVWVTQAGDRTVAVHGDEEFGAHVRVVDVDNDGVAFLNTIGEWETRPEVSVHNILAADGVAFVTYYQDGVRVLDVSDPADPREIAHLNTWPGAAPGYGHSFFEGAIGIDLDTGTGVLYVADTHRGLLVARLDP